MAMHPYIRKIKKKNYIGVHGSAPIYMKNEKKNYVGVHGNAPIYSKNKKEDDMGRIAIRPYVFGNQ